MDRITDGGVDTLFIGYTKMIDGLMFRLVDKWIDGCINNYHSLFFHSIGNSTIYYVDYQHCYGTSEKQIY